ncbi:MAG: uracil phosphoribosyltransferase [Rhodospirillaceae bacterium]|nr:uracil phosphoribosyltransferase [Rhodospirillaceae bacterium]
MSESLDYFINPQSIRDCAMQIKDLTCCGDGVFKLNESHLEFASEIVVDSIQQKYPTYDIPLHSRWRHFEIENTHSLQKLNTETKEYSSIERARTGLDLIIPSVLLDAGAGPNWRFKTESGISLSRSEGLAIASLEMFLSGLFSNDSNQPLRTDAEALANLSLLDFTNHMQSSEKNLLVGLNNRLLLLQQLGKLILQETKVFPNGRLGDLADYLVASSTSELSATYILSTILKLLGPMWPQRIMISGINLGDAWKYSHPQNREEKIIPFHKLSQWLSYSIIETMLRSGYAVCDIEQLTGLAEYRNGGLFIDTGVLELKDEFIQTSYYVDSRTVIEWRALTVYLLDQVSKRVSNAIGKKLSLAKVLEGGTWHAGRKLAYERSSTGKPPINIKTDGTVF